MSMVPMKTRAVLSIEPPKSSCAIERPIRVMALAASMPPEAVKSRLVVIAYALRLPVARAVAPAARITSCAVRVRVRVSYPKP